MTNSSKDKDKRSGTDTARRIWLAGIGAYGRAFTEAQEAFKEASGRSTEVFEELVKKGEKMEKVVEEKSKSMMGKAQMPDFDLDERIKAMRARMSRGADAVAEAVTGATGKDVEDRLDSLEAKLDKILKQLEPKKPARKPAAKKPTAKKATTTRTKKTTAKKSPAKTPAAKTSKTTKK